MRFFSLGKRRISSIIKLICLIFFCFILFSFSFSSIYACMESSICFPCIGEVLRYDTICSFLSLYILYYEVWID